MNRFVRFSCLAGMTVFVAACQSASVGPPPPIVRPDPRPTIEGNWVDPNGIISSFRSGRFETRTTDTNSLLASGDYRFVSDQLVQINLLSQLRGTTSTVNCSLVGPSRLNCTSDAGDQFSLARQAAG